MKREQILQTATNYYRYRMGAEPENIMIKSMEPANGRIVLQAKTTCAESDDAIRYEIELQPTTNSISMKRILSEHSMSDFMNQPKQ